MHLTPGVVLKSTLFARHRSSHPAMLLIQHTLHLCALPPKQAAISIIAIMWIAIHQAGDLAHPLVYSDRLRILSCCCPVRHRFEMTSFTPQPPTPGQPSPIQTQQQEVTSPQPVEYLLWHRYHGLNCLATKLFFAPCLTFQAGTLSLKGSLICHPGNEPAQSL